jgi:hypothetical protein
VQECIRHEILHLRGSRVVGRGPAASGNTLSTTISNFRRGGGGGGGRQQCQQGRAIRNTSGPARGNWLGNFCVGGVPLCLCCGVNRAMRGVPVISLVPGGWWLVTGCLLPAALNDACAYATYFAATYTAPSNLLFLLSAGLQVAVGAATDPYYYPLVLPHHQPTLPSPPMPTLWCPAATNLVVLLCSYLQPSHLPFLLSAGLQVRLGAGGWL